MSDDRGVLRAISWRDCCPWILIFRVFGIAISFQVLLLAAGGAIATTAGWRLCGIMLYGDAKADIQDTDDVALQATLESLSQWPGQQSSSGDRSASPRYATAYKRSPLLNVWQRLSFPFQHFFSQRPDVKESAYFLVGGLWTLLVWSYFGGAITRTAALQLSIEQRSGLGEVSSFALRKLGSFFSAPLLPLMAALAIAWLIGLFVGLPARWEGALWLSGILWIFALVGGFVMTLLLIGVLFGWPLMWATISSEGTDAFDGLSRGYGYTFQRPLRYLFYIIVAALLGAVGWFVVRLFSEKVIELTYWSVSWGAGVDRFDELRKLSDPSSLVSISLTMTGFMDGLIRTIATAFGYSFFWTAFTAIYLLLRYDVDQTETDEVYVEESDETYGLPPLEKDAAGIPKIADKPADSDSGE